MESRIIRKGIFICFGGIFSRKKFDLSEKRFVCEIGYCESIENSAVSCGNEADLFQRARDHGNFDVISPDIRFPDQCGTSCKAHGSHGVPEIFQLIFQFVETGGIVPGDIVELFHFVKLFFHCSFRLSC